MGSFDCRDFCNMYIGSAQPVSQNNGLAFLQLSRNFELVFYIYGQSLASAVPFLSILEIRDEGNDQQLLNICTGTTSVVRVLYNGNTAGNSGPSITGPLQWTLVTLRHYNGVVTLFTSNDINNVFTYDFSSVELNEIASRTFTLYISGLDVPSAGGFVHNIMVQRKIFPA